MQPSAIAAPGLIWAVPFLGVLASIAVLPALAPRLWHRRAGTVAGFWIAALVLAQALAAGPATAAAAAWHAVLTQYLPFISLLFALYAAAGGVLIRGGATGGPAGNTAMLAAGMAMGTVMGQAGAAMVLIHPLLRANRHRRRKLHLVLFVIVLVANAGGALSPLGNPPLYIGFLEGVPLFWTARHLAAPLLLLAGVLLAAFYAIDRRLAAAEPAAPPARRLRLRGWGNVGLILLSGIVVLVQNATTGGEVRLFGQPIGVTRLAAIAAFVAITTLSVALTPRAIRQANDFAWAPMLEVGTLFLAIFITIAPVLRMLEAGLQGPLAGLLRLTSDAAGAPRPAAYFWLAGMLSALLDNAPTYLVFFKLAGLHPPPIEPGQARVLAALSAGAVFGGGLTYIGNAPNLLLRGIAAQRGVRMPGFFGFTALAAALLLPVLALLTVVFFL